ncbi:MAG TPA: MotA/TolQ/ExbB proton channel family protein [Terriglobales bacterium]|nr:MotA/TolQ/ExbB proton channel family protein [Terriglobales bacterium]
MPLPEPGACLSLWPTEECRWSTWDIWHSSDVIERAILIGLALMLANNFFVVIRFWWCCYLVRRELRTFRTDGPEMRRANSKLVAGLLPGVAMLRGIASAAPFLGLAGTAYGIMAGAFVGFSMEKSAAMRALMVGIAASLVTAAAGILVAIPAALSHNLLRTRIETLSASALSIRRSALTGSSQGPFILAQTLPLKSRFSGLPHFSAVAAPALASVVVIFMAFEPYVRPMGLPVALPSFPCQPNVLSDRLIVLRVRWAELSTRLSAIYSSRVHRELYFLAQDEVPFQTVADAIDVVQNSRAEGANSLDITVKLITPQAEAESEACMAASLERSRRIFPLRSRPRLR